MQGLKPSAPVEMHMENGPFPSLCLAPSPLLHLWLLMASVNYSAILKLLSCIDIRAAEEQGEDEVVGHGKSWLAGVHSAPHLMLFAPADVIAIMAGLCIPSVCQQWEQGEKGHSTRSGPSIWARAVSAAGICSTASTGEVPTSVCRLGHRAAD